MIPNILNDNNTPSGNGYNNLVPGTLQIITDVVVEPITLEELKRHLRVEFSDDDIYLQGTIAEAREEIEDELNLALGQKTIKVGIRNPKGDFKLPYWTPEAELIELTDKDGEVITADSYEFSAGILETSYSEIVYAEYSTGYEMTPVKYKRKILERASYLYNHRGDASKNVSKIWL